MLSVFRLTSMQAYGQEQKTNSKTHKTISSTKRKDIFLIWWKETHFDDSLCQTNLGDDKGHGSLVANLLCHQAANTSCLSYSTNVYLFLLLPNAQPFTKAVHARLISCLQRDAEFYQGDLFKLHHCNCFYCSTSIYNVNFNKDWYRLETLNQYQYRGSEWLKVMPPLLALYKLQA